MGSLRIGPFVESLPAFQPHEARERSIGIFAGGTEKQGDCESDEHQSKHREGHPTTDYDQDGWLFPLGSTVENYRDLPAVIVSLFDFSSTVASISSDWNNRRHPDSTRSIAKCSLTFT